ncbi:hypothetical protein ACLOJK_020976 [Asimina triloba]
MAARSFQSHPNSRKMAAAAASAVAAAAGCVRVKASWDLNPHPIPVVIPNLPKKKNPSKTLRSGTNQNPSDAATSAATAPPPPLQKKKNKDHPLPILELFKIDHGSTNSKFFSQNSGRKRHEQYLGYDRWLPAAPKVEKPRSIYNAAALAYIGDSIYEDALLKKLLDEDYLSKEERDILRWGKNIGSGKTRTVKRAGVAVYNRASSLEALVGYLYLTDVERLDEVMLKLGFSTGSSAELVLKEKDDKIIAYLLRLEVKHQRVY